MVALADVRRWDPAAVASAADQLRNARDQLIERDYDLAASRPPTGWLGVAADAARAEHERLAERLRRVVAGVAAVRPTVSEVADAITGLHQGIADAEGLAAANGFTVAEDGTVTDVLQTVIPLDQVEEYRRTRRALQAEIIDRLMQVLRRAMEIDNDLTAVLRRAAAEQVDDGDHASLVSASIIGNAAGGLELTGPPPDGTVGDNAGWWDALSDAEQAQVTSEHPDWVGNLDGIPAGVRDEANRGLLTVQLQSVNAEIAATQARIAEYPPFTKTGVEARDLAALRVHLGELKDRKAPLVAVQRTIGDPGHRQLLLLDTDHERPRAAIGIGNVDTADHVAVIAPGFGSTVEESFAQYDPDMARLLDATEDSLDDAGRDHETVAGVTWIGYDVPQAGTTLDGDQSVLTPDAARAGGLDLARFYDGIDASRPTDPHLTALGHSYGSVTTGYALQHANGVDDAVVTGSPGLGTGDIRDLHVAPGHLGVLEADRDGVADSGWFHGDPNQLEGVVNLSSDEERIPGRADPLERSTGHSDYLSPDTTSQHNIAQTVAGLHDRRIEGDNSGFGDEVRDRFGKPGGVAVLGGNLFLDLASESPVGPILKLFGL